MKSKIEKILVVDDEEGVRNFLGKFFELRGYPTAFAASGEEALSCLKNECPSVILLDMNMPGMSGLETLKKIRAINPTIGVVMATGLQDEAVAQEAIKLGAYAYVVKPFDMKYLDSVVLTCLTMGAE